MRSSRVYIVYVKDPSDLIIYYLISKSLGNAYLQTVGNANVDSLDYSRTTGRAICDSLDLTLGARAPRNREPQAVL